MPDPKFSKPWHGIPNETINWNPTVNADATLALTLSGDCFCQYILGQYAENIPPNGQWLPSIHIDSFDL